MTTHPTKPYVTKTGRVLTGADLDALADEVAGDIDVATLKPRPAAARHSPEAQPTLFRSDSTPRFAPRSKNEPPTTTPPRAT